MSFSHSTLSLAIFAVFTATAYADDDSLALSDQQPNQPAVNLNTIVIEANKEKNEVGTTVYTEEQLKKMPNGKKTISEFLRQNSNVQFSRDSLDSSNQASLAPEKISINGAKFYENKFVVNGVNTSNTLDPVGESTDASFSGVPSQAQTANINTDLLCELEVIDSNASAEHGEFQGGVISAKTCAPKTEIGKIHGSVGVDYTTSAWSRFNFVDTNEELDSENLEAMSANQYQKDYDIYGISASLYGKLNEKWGLSLNSGFRNSIIPVLSGYSDKKINTKEFNNSLGITAFYTPNDTTKYQFGVDLYDYSRDGYISNNIRSDYSIDTTTNAFYIQSEHQFKNFKLENNLNYRETESKRELDQDYSSIWIYSLGDKDWKPNSTTNSTLGEGGVGGDLTNKQTTFSYDIKATFDTLNFFDTAHQFKIGAGYKHNEGTWDRNSDFASYTGSGYAKILNDKGKYVDDISNPNRGNLGDAVCATGDYLCSNTPFDYSPTSGYPLQQWNGQYLKNGTFYGAGKVSAQQDQWSLFIEDGISWKNFKARLGVRADYDSLASNFNVAPRTNIEYKPFNNDLIRLTSGFNRYYGVTYLTTELTEKANSYKGSLSRDNSYSSDWNKDNNYGWVMTPSTPTLGTKATDLNTPYNDETMFSVDGKFANLMWGLKWVNRDFKDTIRQNAKLKSYENINGGEADTYTFTLQNIQPYNFINTEHTFNLGISYVNDETYASTYRATNSTTQDNWAMVNGQLYQIGTIPTKDSPLTARLNWLIESKSKTWAWNNFLNYRSGSTNYTATKEKVTIDDITATIYEETDFASKFTWDTRLTYNWNLAKNQNLTLGLTVSNILNKSNQAVTTNNFVYSEEGRRFIVDAAFKF